MRKRRLPDPASKSSRLDPSVFFLQYCFLSGGGRRLFLLQGIRRRQRDQGISESLCAGFGRGRNCHHSVSSRAAVSYYRVPCAVYLCGVFRHAFYLICGVFLLEGFLLSFAVANFTLALGRSGVLSPCVFLAPVS